MSRRSVVIAASLAVALTVAPSAIHSRPVLIWNASPSAPIGLYTMTSAEHLHDGDLVAITPPRPLAEFMSRRGYLPIGVPLLKHVAATAGHQLCRHRRSISIDGVTVAMAFDRDRRHRPLPTWSGCHRLARGEIFALNATVPDSLDGRYFGVLSAASVIGRARPIWLTAAPSERPS